MIALSENSCNLYGAFDMNIFTYPYTGTLKKNTIMHIAFGIITTVIFLSVSSYCIATSQLSSTAEPTVKIDSSNQLIHS